MLELDPRPNVVNLENPSLNRNLPRAFVLLANINILGRTFPAFYTPNFNVNFVEAKVCGFHSPYSELFLRSRVYTFTYAIPSFPSYFNSKLRRWRIPEGFSDMKCSQ